MVQKDISIPMTNDPIIAHYERCLEQHGDSHLGVDWPNQAGADTRMQVMLGIRKAGSIGATVLDFGCGVGHLYEYQPRTGAMPIQNYTGYDASEKMIAVAAAKFPHVKFTSSWGLVSLDKYDYVILNGVLTEKRTLTFEAMWQHSKEVLKKAWSVCRVGMAFNVMTSHTTTEKREDLFYLELDTMARWVLNNLSRNVIVRQDYGLWEYTVYVYR